jgi:hypothetical protein
MTKYYVVEPEVAGGWRGTPFSPELLECRCSFINFIINSTAGLVMNFWKSHCYIVSDGP